MNTIKKGADDGRMTCGFPPPPFLESYYPVIYEFEVKDGVFFFLLVIYLSIYLIIYIFYFYFYVILNYLLIFYFYF